MMSDAEEIVRLCSDGLSSSTQKYLLGRSLYYYACGTDPTPIIAFEEQYPLYIYVDSFLYISKTFREAADTLYQRLEFHRFYRAETFPLSRLASDAIEQAELTVWHTKSRREFMLLYVKADAEACYSAVYGDPKHPGGILPRCICNYLYEISTSTKSLQQAEQSVPFVLGHCFSEKHHIADRIPYYGDYGSTGTGVNLYIKS